MRTLILLATLMSLSSLQDDSPDERPGLNVDGAISLKRFLETADQYRDDTATIIGVVSYKTHYQGRYKDASDTYESIAFHDPETITANVKKSAKLADLPVDAWLYLRKTPEAKLGYETLNIDSTESNIGKDGKSLYVLVRVKVSAKDEKNPNLLEVEDFSVCYPEVKTWGPWKVKQQDERLRKQFLYWRDWRDSKGKTFRAKYEKIISGVVHLTTKEGQTVKLKMSELTDDEKKWLKDRPWDKKPKPSTSDVEESKE